MILRSTYLGESEDVCHTAATTYIGEYMMPSFLCADCYNSIAEAETVRRHAIELTLNNFLCH